jgi:hypothetical protein
LNHAPGILYATGNIAQIILTTLDGEASLTKPYRAGDLLRSLEIVRDIVATGRAPPPIPHGFRVLAPPLFRVPAHG